MSLPPGLRLYRTLTAAAAGLAPGILQWRAMRGKEDPARLTERLGQSAHARGDGPLVWLHGASVGETVLGMALAERLRTARPGLRFLHTSGTRTSADLAARRLGPDARHVYAPVDTPGATQAFIAHWRPDLGVFLEGEIWPNLLLAAQGAGVPLALVNARMTAASARGWAKWPASAQALFDAFALALPADGATASVLAALRAGPIGPSGNLKLAAPAPPVHEASRVALAAAVAGRPVWLAASTHPGEEALALAAHGLIRMAASDALLILAPRHPERAADVDVDCRKAGLAPVRRSCGQVPGADDSVWLWDTLGELGLAYAMAPVSLMGGSLVAGVGGHNPVEPARIGSAIVTGPFTHNFADTFASLDAAGGARVLADAGPAGIARAVSGLIGDAGARAAMARAALAVCEGGEDAMARTVAGVLGLLDRGPD